MPNPTPTPTQVLQQQTAARTAAQKALLAKRLHQPSMRTYIYPVKFTGLVVATLSSQLLKMDAKYDFACYGMNIMHFVTATGVLDDPSISRVRLSDTASGKYWSSASMLNLNTGANDLSANGTIGNNYFHWTLPRIIPKNARINIDLTPAVLSAGVTKAWVFFYGAQIAEYS